MPSWITAILSICASVGKLFSRNQDIINDPAIKKASQAQDDQDRADQINRDIQKGDVDKVRRRFER